MFAAARDTPPNLYVKRIGAAGDEERLFRNTLQSFPQSWSPDGRFIAYVTVDPKTAADIWLLPLAGDRKPTPLLQTRFTEQHARISPDGRWMAYSSNESGRQDVYVTRFPEPGGKWPVSTNGGGFPVWRRDGRELFYRALRWNAHGGAGRLPAPTSRPARRSRSSSRALQSAASEWARSTTSRLTVVS